MERLALFIIVVAILGGCIFVLHRKYKACKKKSAEEKNKAEQKIREATEMASQDPLTGLRNGRYLKTRLAEEVSRAARINGSLYVLFIDIDDFKKVNDSLGHKTGDALLIEIAKILKKSLRPYDIVSRYGGDEFVVVLTEGDKSAANVVANKIVRQIKEISLNGDMVGSIIGASIGISRFDPQNPKRDLIDIADKAMYKEKEKKEERR